MSSSACVAKDVRHCFILRRATRTCMLLQSVVSGALITVMRIVLDVAGTQESQGSSRDLIVITIISDKLRVSPHGHGNGQNTRSMYALHARTRHAARAEPPLNHNIAKTGLHCQAGATDHRIRFEASLGLSPTHATICSSLMLTPLREDAARAHALYGADGGVDDAMPPPMPVVGNLRSRPAHGSIP